MKKYLKLLSAAAIAVLLIATLTYTGCKKADLEESDYEQLTAAQQFTNSQLVHLIKLNDPPLSDKELMGIMIAASPLDNNIIKELLKRGQPPCSCPLSDETLQMILLFNLPLSDHILKELEKRDISLSRSLVDNITLADLPDMELKQANLLMESLLNLKFGDGLSLFHKVEPVTTAFQVQGTLQSGKYFVLAQEFIQIVNDLELICNGAPGTITTPCISKHIVAVDLEIITSEDPFTGDKVFDVDLTAIVGLELPQPAGLKCFFTNPVENWKAYGATDCPPDVVAGSGGICFSANTGQFPNNDAAEEIEKIVNTNFCGYLEGSCEIFTNIQTVIKEGGDSLIPNPTDIVIEDNKFDFLLFHSSEHFPFDQLPSNHHDCVKGDYFGYFVQDSLYETNELKFYLEGTLEVVNDFNPLPLTHEPFAIDLVGCKTVSFPNDKLFHILTTCYAHVCGLPVIDL